MRWIQAATVTLAVAFVVFAMRSCAAARDDADLVLVGMVQKVVDGDTIDVLLDSGKIRVRMQGIDAPERGQPLCDEATAQLRQLVDGREVELQPAGQLASASRPARRAVGVAAEDPARRRSRTTATRRSRAASLRSASLPGSRSKFAAQLFVRWPAPSVRRRSPASHHYAYVS